MPYPGQKASKTGHCDLPLSPGVAEVLRHCAYRQEPDGGEALEVIDSYRDAPSGGPPPRAVVASDGSVYSEVDRSRFPGTQMGYVNVSLAFLDVPDYEALRAPGGRFVDPFAVAALLRDAHTRSFALPGANVRYKDTGSTQEGFRLAVWEQMSSRDTALAERYGTDHTLCDTLLALHEGCLRIERCPDCGADASDRLVFTEATHPISCPECRGPVFPTDVLRLHEPVADYNSVSASMTRFMNVAEHLQVATLVRALARQDPRRLSQTAFLLDGPLAIFGEPARLSRLFMTFYHDVSRALTGQGLPPLLLMGLQKTGTAMEHALGIARHLPPNVFRMIDDAYRNRYLAPVRNDHFGYETYFGQDFILKTRSGRLFVVGLPYPCSGRTGAEEFSARKADLSAYGAGVARAFDVIRRFECDLYENALVPIALAHQQSSISQAPGGKVLDALTRLGLGAP